MACSISLVLTVGAGIVLSAPPPPSPPPPSALRAPADTGTPSVAQPVMMDDGARRTVGIVGFEGDSPHAEGLAYALSRVLRHRGHAVGVKSSSDELRTVSGCDLGEVGCAQQLAEQLGVDLVLHGRIEHRGSAVLIRLWLVDPIADEPARTTMWTTERDLAGHAISVRAAELAGQLWPRRQYVTALERRSTIAEPPSGPRRSVPVWAVTGIAVAGVMSTAGLLLAGLRPVGSPIGGPRVTAGLTLATVGWTARVGLGVAAVRAGRKARRASRRARATSRTVATR